MKARFLHYQPMLLLFCVRCQVFYPEISSTDLYEFERVIEGGRACEDNLLNSSLLCRFELKYCRLREEITKRHTLITNECPS